MTTPRGIQQLRGIRVITEQQLVDRIGVRAAMYVAEYLGGVQIEIDGPHLYRHYKRSYNTTLLELQSRLRTAAGSVYERSN